MTDEQKQLDQASTDGMRSPPETVEQEIQRKGLTAPRVTPADIEANISAEYSFTLDKATQACPQHESLKLVTVSVLVLRNGFVIVGKSACASPANFDAEIGRKIARSDATRQMWEPMGYALREQLAKADER